MMHQGILSVAIPLLLLPSVAYSAFIITEPLATRTKTSFAKSVKGGEVVNIQIPPSLSSFHNENEKRSARRSSLLRMSSVEDESAARNDDNGMDSMRKMLESSWDVETMGVVPSDPQKAAESAATSIGKAIRDGKKLLCIDLLLPTYDASAGDNVYDEVLAVEFCTALSTILCQEDSGLNLKQCAVLVDEGRSERAVKRLFDGREKQRLEEEAQQRQTEANTIDNDDEEDEDEETLFSDDADLFRQQLSSTWNDEIDSTTIPPSDDGNNQPPPEQTEASSSISSSPYRIGSRIGDAQIPDGPDMFEQVMKAVDNQAVQASDDAIILVSPYSRKDMIAARRIVSRFGPSGPNSHERKPIILVNCKLNPLPQELNPAETVYSLLPLIARPKAPSGPGPQQSPPGMPPPPKIVVLRRYPDDWEVFVDADGLGFELVDKAQANQCGPKGPPMQWISGCVQRHMTFKLGNTRK